jgi:hypothetical protein
MYVLYKYRSICAGKKLCVVTYTGGAGSQPSTAAVALCLKKGL